MHLIDGEKEKRKRKATPKEETDSNIVEFDRSSLRALKASTGKEKARR